MRASYLFSRLKNIGRFFCRRVYVKVLGTVCHTQTVALYEWSSNDIPIHIGELVQGMRNSIALIMELRLSCINPSICLEKLEMTVRKLRRNYSLRRSYQKLERLVTSDCTRRNSLEAIQRCAFLTERVCERPTFYYTISIGPNDNDSTHHWPPGSLHTMGAGWGHV